MPTSLANMVPAFSMMMFRQRVADGSMKPRAAVTLPKENPEDELASGRHDLQTDRRRQRVSNGRLPIFFCVFFAPRFFGAGVGAAPPCPFFRLLRGLHEAC